MAIAEIETALVGAVVADPERIVSVADVVSLADFSDEKAQLAYGAALELWKSRQPVNLVTVCNRLQSVPGIAVYLAQATTNAIPPSAATFADEIAKAAKGRRIRAAIEAALKSHSPAEMLDDLMAIYRSEMQAGRKMPEISEVLKRVDEIVRANAKRGVLGIRTGFEALDKVYARFIPGHIWTVGGFTSVGKTATMVQMVCNVLASPDQPSIVIISTEMTEEQVVGRIVSNFTGVPSFRILSGKFHDEEEADTVARCKEHLATMPLAIYDDIYRLGEIETAFHKADLRGGVQIGIIDYVQNCRWPEAKSQYQEQSEMAKRFQALAKDVRCTLVCLSQVSNDVGRGNTDQLELKGAGEWAAVSDYGVMLSRHKTEKHRLKFDLKKNRHGALTEFELEYKNDFTRLEEKR